MYKMQNFNGLTLPKYISKLSENFFVEYYYITLQDSTSFFFRFIKIGMKMTSLSVRACFNVDLKFDVLLHYKMIFGIL